jgi:hypothetical protein
MGKPLREIGPEHERFILDQKVFFVATAPLDAAGHVNLSPKGIDGSFAVLGPGEVAYLDYTGSGVETIAHLRENGRIVLMFCAFEGSPKILRLHGTGSVIWPGDEAFAKLRSRLKAPPEGERSIILVNVTRVATSCGWGVPVMKYESDREKLIAWSSEKGPDGLAEYRQKNNAMSLDGLPGLPSELA